MNKWLLIPDECFTVGRLRLPGFRFKTTKKIKDIWGPLKKEVRSTVLKKWLKYTRILFPSVNCHRIVIANASAAVMASGVDESGCRIMERHLCGEKGAWASVCGQEELSRCGRARLSAQPLTWNQSRRESLDSAPLCAWPSEMLGCSQQMKRFLLCSCRLGNKSWLSLVLTCWVMVKWLNGSCLFGVSGWGVWRCPYCGLQRPGCWTDLAYPNLWRVYVWRPQFVRSLISTSSSALKAFYTFLWPHGGWCLTWQ